MDTPFNPVELETIRSALGLESLRAIEDIHRAITIHKSIHGDTLTPANPEPVTALEATTRILTERYGLRP